MALRFIRNCSRPQIFSLQRSYSEDGSGYGYSSSSTSRKRGLVLGMYTEGTGDSQEFRFTTRANTVNTNLGGKLEDLLQMRRSYITKGEVQIFQNVESEYHSIALTGLGPEEVGYNTLENLDECRENVRIAAAMGTRALSRMGVGYIAVEGFGQAEAAAEGAALAAWRFQDYKDPETRKIVPTLELYNDEDVAGWQRGLVKAEAQNLARRLSDTPSNIMTPTAFALATEEAVCPCGVAVEMKSGTFITDKKMNLFGYVARGSGESPIILELSYCGGNRDDKPIVFVGKGVTHDTGGLCLKKCKPMSEYKGDMAGAAVIVGTMQAAATLSLPINLKAVIPLCENMPSGMAMKPGDVVFSSNGKSIEIENTDNEGRLIMADAMLYAREYYSPRIIIDVATLTRGMRSALGGGAAGVYTNNHDLWREINKAGAITGDRVWRFPLWNHFTKKVTYKRNADIANVGMGPGGSPCRGAAFLKEFVSCNDWIHLDITGVGMRAHSYDHPYLTIGRMTGRPTRTLVQFLQQLACPAEEAGRK